MAFDLPRCYLVELLAVACLGALHHSRVIMIPTALGSLAPATRIIPEHFHKVCPDRYILQRKVTTTRQTATNLVRQQCGNVLDGLNTSISNLSTQHVAREVAHRICVGHASILAHELVVLAWNGSQTHTSSWSAAMQSLAIPAFFGIFCCAREEHVLQEVCQSR